MLIQGEVILLELATLYRQYLALKMTDQEAITILDQDLV